MQKKEKYTVDFMGANYIVRKNNIPVSLEGVGTLIFYTRSEAERYINMVYEASYYIEQGVPE